MGNPSLLFPSLWFVCIVSYPFTVSPSACLFFLWPFTKYLKTGIKLFLYYLFFRLNKPVSPRHKDSTPDAASQVSNTVKKKNSCHQAAVLLYGVIFQHQGPNVTCIQFSAHQNSQDILTDLLFFFFKLFRSLYCCIRLTSSQFQNFTPTFVELHKVSVSPFLKLAKTPLKIYPALPCINYGPNLMLSMSSLRLASVLWPRSQIVSEKPLRTVTCNGQQQCFESLTATLYPTCSLSFAYLLWIAKIAFLIATMLIFLAL